MRSHLEKVPALEALLPFIWGNVGLVFTNEDPNAIRAELMKNKVQAAAKAGAVSPVDVHVPAGGTGQEPTKTSFFQALSIPTKIMKGAIEIINDVHLIKVGEKVTMSHVAMLDKMNIKPFFYGFKVTDVYEDGTMYSADVLDMEQSTILTKFLGGVRQMAAISLAIGYPTAASVSHSINFAFKKLLALSLETSIEFEQSKKFKDYLANPSAFAAAAPAAAPAAGGAKPAAAAKVVKKKTTSEDDGGGGFSLFD